MLYETYIDSDGQELIVEILSSGKKVYRNYANQCHRLNGPAIEWPDGDYSWYKNDKYHRVGGPAYFFIFDNYCEWWINNKLVSIYYICG